VSRPAQTALQRKAESDFLQAMDILSAKRLSTRLRGFVVEDEFVLSLIIEDMLDAAGCSIVATAHQLGEAIEAAKTLNFDFAVIDVNLDGEASYPVAEILEKRRVPFIFATSYGPDGVAQRWRKAPILRKPFLSIELESAVKSLFFSA
jgi:CheY-like chemotaxis protein